MSEDSDSSPLIKRKRKNNNLEDSSSGSGSPSSSHNSIILPPRRNVVRRIEDDSESSGSSIELRPKRKPIPRVSSGESESSDSDIAPRLRRPGRLQSDSESDSDHGFEGSSGSQWEEGEISNLETVKQDTGVESDSSDGQSEKCPICLISFSRQEIGTPESCDHNFCVECILEWSKNMNTCPVDRIEYHVIQVKHNLHSDVYKKIPVETPNPQNDVEILEDPTFCEVCGLSDREDTMLLCDGCDLGFHLQCLTPPLVEIPAGAWFCTDCSPDDVVNPEIELMELQLLLDDAAEIERPTTRRRSTSRLVPRTRQSERVRRRIAHNRNNRSTEETVTSTSATTRRPRRRKKRAKYRTVYEVDEATGETVAKRIKRKTKKRKRKKKIPRPRTTPKGRLASQLGICAPRSVPQSLPDMRVASQNDTIQNRRYQAGIPSLRLFGDPDELDEFFEDEDDGVVVRRSATRRRNLIKNSVSSSTDVLGSILDAQARFHSKSTKFSLDSDGNFSMQPSERVLRELNNFSGLTRRAPGSYTDSDRGDSVPTSSRQSNSPDHGSTLPTSTVESNATASSANSEEREQDRTDLCTIYDVSMEEEQLKESKKPESEDNTPRSGTPASESEIDIYSDIETVSTSKVDESDLKSASTPPLATNSDDDNDSESDMVIDTEKTNPEPELEESKEETTVTSTVDSNAEPIQAPTAVTSSSEIQSQAIQSSNQQSRYEDEDSEDGCPNFSIYSKESIIMAKNTDIEYVKEDNDQVGEVSSSPVEKQKEGVCTGLYSDSEDESVVKKLKSTFGIADLSNMTEDISEEERSYTPCLDERPRQEGLEGLDTEMISDEDRNDFDESHELKTASDGDALEINAKESELDFTRPDDYEEGEIVDKSKKKAEQPKKEEEVVKQDESEDKTANKENEQNKESAFKKISKSNKERNYRDKDRDRSKSRERVKDGKKEKRKEKRKEIERYDVRALIAEKPRRLKDEFGRDIRRTKSRSRTKTPSLPRHSPSPRRNSRRRSLSKRRSSSRGRKKRRRSRRRSFSRSKTKSPKRRRSRSTGRKRRRSLSIERRRSRDKSKGRSKKRRSRSVYRSRSPTPKRSKEWSRRQSRDWTPSFSRSRTPEPRQVTPSWTPPRIMDTSVKHHHLTVILPNDTNKKKKEKKKKSERKAKENERSRKKKRSDTTPPPSKEVFASGDNILVSVSFNKDNETRDISTKKKRDTEEVSKKQKKDKTKKKKKRDLTGVKPVAIIDLARSPFKELTPSPKDVIVLTDSENEETRALNKCDSSQQVETPERLNTYTTGPKTPPEPQVKFTLMKTTQLRAITNPLHEPDDIEPEDNTQEIAEGHKGPNTPPEPPNSPPSSPDAYDPFEPTKSRSATPEPLENTQSNTTLEDNRDDSAIEARTDIEQQQQEIKSLTPPLAEIQPADSQSSIQITPESSLGKSPERVAVSAPIQTVPPSKPIAQTIPFSSVATSIITSTPASTSLAPPRINILNSTLITPVATQRIVLPTTPVKISPSKSQIKSTPIKPMPAKRKTNRNQNGSENAEASLGLDSPYSPGSSDYEDLFEPPAEAGPKAASKPAKNTKSPSKVQSAFDALFGSSPFNKTKKQDKAPPAAAKFQKKPANASTKTKQVGVKLDEDNLKILDELPNSAVEMQVKDKFLKKLNRQERVVEEVKLVLKPHYNKKHVNKEEYKDILRRAVPKICHNKSGEINPTKIKNLIEAYVKKVRQSKKVTSSSSVNPQKN